MLFSQRGLAVALSMSLFLWGPVAQAEELNTMKEDPVHVNTWNGFMEKLLDLHEQRVAQQELSVSTKQGGYAGQPDFYIEKEFRNKQGELVSRVQWEKENPDRLHAIELYIRDEQGRVIRDYAGAYLPHYRNAPTQTLISFHAYNGNGDLHAFRTFDASGDLLFERCVGERKGDDVYIQLDYDDIYEMLGRPNTTLTSALIYIS
ncbi:MAG: hypothetical protein HUJ29_11785 [Gammaproteobacteria bacterium]|nr:hypothetical protein [Gammaproteobacteria bacterium]